MAVSTGAIVEGLDVVVDLGRGELPGCVDALLDPRLLQAANKGFGHGVIPTVATSAHAGLTVMRRVYERGWITTRDGNISMRKREGKYLYITPSGWRKTIVHPEHVVRIEIVKEPLSGELIPKIREGQHPSGELSMHWNLQRDGEKQERSCMSTPLTSWPPYMPASTCRPSAQNSLEISRYTRVGPTVPTLPALSRELADATAVCLASARMER